MTHHESKNHEIHCKNCQTEFAGNYCPTCGQKGNIHRITWHQVFHDIQHQVLHVDRGLFYTLREMMIRPAKVITEFIAGRRIAYFHPISYLLAGSALSLFVMSGFKEKLMKFVTKGIDPNLNQARQQLNSDIYNSIQGHYNLFLAVFIPFLAFCSWLVFRKHKYNYTEHLVVHAYMTGHTAFMGVILTPLILLFTDSYGIYMLANSVSYIYMMWVMYGVFKQQTATKTILRLLLYLLTLVGLFVIISILIGITMGLLKAFFGINPLHV